MKLLSVFFTGWGSLVIKGENFLKIAFGSERVGSAGEPILFTCNSKPMLRLKFWNYDPLRVGLIRQPLCIMYIPSSKRSQMGLYPQQVTLPPAHSFQESHWLSSPPSLWTDFMSWLKAEPTNKLWLWSEHKYFSSLYGFHTWLPQWSFIIFVSWYMSSA